MGSGSVEYSDYAADYYTPPAETYMLQYYMRPQATTNAMTSAGRMNRASMPVSEEFMRQAMEILQTGGANAQVPMIQRSVEASKAATSGALRGLDAQLATSGLAGTPYGEQIRAQTAMQGAMQTGQIPAQFSQQYLQLASQFAGQMQQTAMGGFTGTSGAEATAIAAAYAALSNAVNAATQRGISEMEAEVGTLNAQIGKKSPMTGWDVLSMTMNQFAPGAGTMGSSFGQSGSGSGSGSTMNSGNTINISGQIAGAAASQQD